jgi:hypothetical protein
MATYGSRDRNPFQGPETYLLNGVSTPSNLGSTRYYTLVEADGPNKGQITIKSPTIAGNIGGANADRTIGVIPLDNQFKPTPGSITSDELKYFSSAAGQLAVKNHGVITAQKAGAQNAQQLIFPNSAAPGAGQGQNQPPTTPGADPITGDSSSGADPNSDSSTEDAEDLAKEAGTTNKNTRKTYQPDVKYPLNLKSENQDCIKFSIVEYKPPGLKPGGQGSRIVTLNSSRPEIAGEGRTILGTITLPIPGGISDRNSAYWLDNSLGEIANFFAGISMQGILGGGAASGEAAQDGLRAAIPDGDTSSLQSRVAAAMVQEATGSSGILARQYGAVSNENLELLFNGPSLRNFTFNFRFTPREPKEAVAVRRIIRMFKQAMSVKRSESSLLLKTPHTFAISYLSKNKDHPYLNKFKECALTDCAVNYTPDGTYMTYTDSSMTAYELSLTFQELVPIFDDDYFEIDKNQDTSIGF